MRIGRTTFPEEIKRWGFKRFKETYKDNRSAMDELALKGLNLELAYTKLTGKQPYPKKTKKDVSANKKSDSKD